MRMLHVRRFTIIYIPVTPNFKQWCFTSRVCQTLQLKKLSTLENISLSASELSVPVPWGHIAAKRWGKINGKPIIAVHGWQDNAGTFDTLAPLLPKDWDLVCIDLPGHGLSSHFQPGHIYYFREYVAAIIRTLNYLQWTKFSFIGHSLGAGLGILYSCLYPDKVEHLVSLDLIKTITKDNTSSIVKNSWRLCCLEIVRFEQDDRSPPVYSMEEAIEKWRKGSESSPTTKSIKILFNRGAKILPDGNVVFTRDRRILLPIPAMTLLSTEQYKVLIEFMKCKFLIVKAKPGGMYESEKLYGEVMESHKRTCRHFKYVEEPGSHHLHINAPEKVAPHIIDFMK